MTRPPAGATARRLAAAWAAALLLGAAACGLAELAWHRLPRPRPLEELSYYPSGKHLLPMTLGHPSSAADLAWLRAVQYYGEHRRSDNRFVRMAHVFDILTSLDPRFMAAYEFGAFSLAQEGFDFPSAERLMLKGLEANPTSGALAFQLGFLYFVRTGGRDLRSAAHYFEQASRQADAPPQSLRFAAFSRQHSGDLTAAYELWAEVERSTRNQCVRDMARQEMDEIREAIRLDRKELAVRKLTSPAVLLQ